MKTNYYRLVVGLSLVAYVVLGVAGAIDLLDRHVPFVGHVPWMGDHAWTDELLRLASAAVAVPALVAGLLWHGFRAAGLISGVALALLLPVTVTLVVLTLAYQVVEWLSDKAGSLMGLVGGLVVVAAVTITVASLFRG